MKKITGFIVKYRLFFCILFAVALTAAAVCIPLVNVNYESTAYLPDSSYTKAGLAVNNAEFGAGGSTMALLTDADLGEILRIKGEINAVGGVSGVMWLDDIIIPIAGNDTGLDDAGVIEYFLRIIKVLPRSESATPYDIASALKSEFSEDEIQYAGKLMKNLAGILPGGENFDIDALMRLTEPVSAGYIQAVGEMKGRLGAAVSGSGAFVPAFINSLTYINKSGTPLSAEKAMEYLSRAVAVLPSSDGTTFADIYAALSSSFSSAELPSVMRLLAGFGLDFTSLDMTNPYVMASPVPASYLMAIAASKEQLGVAASALSGVEGTFFSLADRIVGMNMSGMTVTGEDAVSYLGRLMKVLPDWEGTVVYDVAAALTGEFTQVELPYILGAVGSLTGGAADFSNADAGQLAMASAPLGASFAGLVTRLDDKIKSMYKDGSALFTITFVSDDYAKATNNAVGDIIKISDSIHLSGSAAANYYQRQIMNGEINNATAIAVVIALAVLAIASSSWLDPLLYVIVIVVAIILNMGSNLIFDSVSYLTESVASILQLALSIDYAVFLINRYKKERKEGKEAEKAMSDALIRSFSPVSASSLTTVACFVTIMFMQYKLGLDMGLVMAKGILLSLLTVFLLLPGVAVYLDKIIAKSEHKTIGFCSDRLSRFTFRYRWLIALLAIAVIIPSAFISGKNTFTYGASAMQGENSTESENRRLIENTFGSAEQLALLVPKDSEKELALTERLASLEGVVSVNSWAQIEAGGLDKVLPEKMRSQFIGAEEYNRIVLTLDCAEEGEETKALLADIRGKTADVYGAGAKFYTLGGTVAALDMEESTSKDFNRISIYSIAAVALIIAVSFGSALIPAVLVIIIEGSIWMNMSVPYIAGERMVFLGYMIIVNILLGATIDYAILLASNYMEARRSLGKAEAVLAAHNNSLRSILTSGIILTFGGMALGITSSFPTIQLLGFSIMRGGICAILMTVFVLPALLAILDKPIRFLTWRRQK